MKRYIQKLIVLLFCALLCIPALVACDGKGKKQDDGKPSFSQVMANYKSATSKSGDLGLKMRVSLYGPNGTPISLTQQVKALRAQKEGYYYVGGEVKTEKISNTLRDYVATASAMINSNGPMDYVDGKTRIAFEGGVYNGFYNGRLDTAAIGEEPDYKVPARNGIDRYAFYGISESDVQAFAEDLGYGEDKPFTLTDYFMYISLDTFDWPQYTDAASSEYNETAQCYDYRLTIPGAALKAAVLAQFDLFALFFAGTQNADTLEILSLYADNKDFAASLFTVSDCTVTATASADAVLLSLGYAFNFGMRLTDQQILDKARQYEIFDKIPEEAVKGLLSTMHLFFSTKNIENNAIEIDFAVEMTENYVYGSAVTVDTASVVFAGAADAPEGRAVYTYAYDEEKQDYTFRKTAPAK